MDQLSTERQARADLERRLADAQATIAALQMQLAAARSASAASAAAPKPREVLSDCSDLSAVRKKPAATTSPPAGGVRKKKSKERTAKPKIPGQSRYWTPDEHRLFLEALRKYGHKDLRSISAYVGTRNMTQCRTHSQKWQMKLMREAKRQNPAGAPAPPTQPPKAPAAAAPPASDGENHSSNGAVSAGAASKSGASSAAATSAAGAVASDPHTDKYSVPNTCGMTLLCLVGQDTLSN